MTELSSTFTARPGGVWTEEVGVITGELEIRTTCTDNGSMSAQVRYAGALEWYTLTGSTDMRLNDPGDHDAVHELLVRDLRNSRR